MKSRQNHIRSAQIVNWGLGTDALVPADYDGDGKADIAVFRDGIWYLQRSRDGFTALVLDSRPTSPFLMRSFLKSRIRRAKYIWLMANA
jgi:hypothetical protein